MEKDVLVFEVEDRGYSARGWYLKAPNDGDALVQIAKGETVLREFKFPAYKIYNIPAHFRDIVDSELAQDTNGYEMAASTGIGPGTLILSASSADNGAT